MKPPVVPGRLVQTTAPAPQGAAARQPLNIEHAPRSQPGPAARRPLNAVISIDTTLSEVAAAALDAGASMTNDVSAGRDDPAMFALAAERGVPIVLMHMLGQPTTMQDNPTYADVVGEVLAFLLERARVAEQAGVARERIILDPGIGFGKTTQHDLELLAALDRFTATPYPILVGASRKKFMARLDPMRESTTPADRLPGTLATTTLATLAGAAIVRVHDVAENRQAAVVAAAVRGA